ncbi:tyrosine-type recombinase/integrase [Defluviitalea raffinosedens]|uniref:Tyrosine-type recombinase/integrase n=1 Tax=Defluviitalea raffinosedens TaxID=1450156 RepID=A0A7C8HE99_9FIRM|nr:tyrosine-type recombinase/integrase [Defluviitalea raffinosedens]KAE9633749.1 tyrosine-type recombinase/integrase [Defluviitalea raffinosedens]
MEGHIRKRGNKWYYSFEAGTVNGKRKRIERVGGRTKKEAEAALRKALQEYENAGLHFEPSEISVADYMDYWLKEYVLLNCKYNTQKNYKNVIENHIKPALGIYKLKSLNPQILQEFINSKYLYGYSKNHLMNMITVLSGSLKYAVHPCKFIKENPMQYVKYPKYEHSKAEIDHKIITKEEFEKIIERFPLGSSFYIPIMIGYHTGCRIGEVMGLTWKDIDLKERTIHVNKIIYKRNQNWYFGPTKTQSSVRSISIGQTLIDALKKHKKLQMENRIKYGQYYTQQYEVEEVEGNDKLRRIYSLPVSINPGTMSPIDMVCTKENGEIVTPDTFKYASRVINYELGIVFNFHSLRHTHATTLIENRANIKDVQKRLGHTRISTTLDTYTHATEAMSKETVNIFEKAIREKK